MIKLDYNISSPEERNELVDKMITEIGQENLNDKLFDKLKFDGFDDEDINHFKQSNYLSLMKSAVDNSDGVIIAEKGINAELEEYVKFKNLPVINYKRYDIDYLADTTDAFFNDIIES